ncbi:MAG: glycosyltransferase family 4 protein [Flavobacteriales bacterium]
MGEAKLNIVIFDGSFETTAFIRRFMQGLVNQGHRITVVGFNEYNPYPVSGVVYQSLGSNQSKRKLITSSFKLAFKYGSLPQILEVLKESFKGNRKELQQQNMTLVFKMLKPDVVHVQWPSLLSWIEPYLGNKNFKIVLSQRGFHVNVRPFVNQDNFKYLEQIYPRLDGLHSVSQAISKIGKQIGKPYTGIDQVVYTGVDLNTLHYKPKQQKETSLKLISIGRPHWIKDYPTAIKACAILKNQDVNFQYTIVGAQGDEELLYLIHDLDLEQNISLTGKMPQDEVYKHVQQADVLLMTSIEEGLANVAVEAIALGTPVISTDCGGMNELITHEVTGWLVPVGQEERLAEQIIKVNALHLDMINQVTTAARLQVERQHNMVNMVAGMEKLYQAVMVSYI